MPPKARLESSRTRRLAREQYEEVPSANEQEEFYPELPPDTEEFEPLDLPNDRFTAGHSTLIQTLRNALSSNDLRRKGPLSPDVFTLIPYHQGNGKAYLGGTGESEEGVNLLCSNPIFLRYWIQEWTRETINRTAALAQQTTALAKQKEVNAELQEQLQTAKKDAQQLRAQYSTGDDEVTTNASNRTQGTTLSQADLATIASMVGRQTGTNRGPRLKIPDPPVFSGESGSKPDFRTWKNELLQKLNSYGQEVAETTKLPYMLTRTEGDAHTHLAPHITTEPNGYQTINEALHELASIYDDPLVRYNKKRELQEHWQGSNTFQEYYAKFSALAVEAQLPKEE